MKGANLIQQWKRLNKNKIVPLSHFLFLLIRPPVPPWNLLIRDQINNYWEGEENAFLFKNTGKDWWTDGEAAKDFAKNNASAKLILGY